MFCFRLQMFYICGINLITIMSYIFNIRLIAQNLGIKYHRIQRELVQGKSSLKEDEKARVSDYMKTATKEALKSLK